MTWNGLERRTGLRTSWIIWYAVVLHILWGVQLIELGLMPSDWHGGVGWHIYIMLVDTRVLGWAMLLAGLLAGAGLFLRPGFWSLACLLPQQIILTIGAIGPIICLLGIGHEFAGSHCIRVAPMVIGAFVFHTCAVIHHHQWQVWIKTRGGFKNGE